ncbi:hypothetical protein CERSUDRAFT_71438 [Gelatoporia subvermispora B]|uniref:F-box domain-containing protein n=1 Tax=Ceriporiopsis subvermispora (strain B) TaxID=914234 RepID=M2QR40_CERS8|nr:hypothetical protein CERSUDRAFT_71438 [Gelatoporia subvermispora B]
MDSTCAYSLSTPWRHSLRTKLTLVQVCKAWRNLALPFLYNRIILYHAEQILYLARTVRDSSNVAHLIKHIHLDCFTARLPEALNEMAFILLEMTRLKSISMGFRFFMGGITHLHRRAIRKFKTALAGLPDSLTELGYCLQSLDNDVPFNLPLRHFNTFPQLTSLTMPLSSSWYTDYKARHAVRLPHLAELELFCREDPDFSIFDSWDMPNLRRLWMTQNPCNMYLFHPKIGLSEFFQRHGGLLEFLDLSEAKTYDALKFGELLRSCTKLRHIVLPWTWVPYLLHKSFGAHAAFHLDIWSHTESHTGDTLGAAEDRILRDARVLDAGLMHLRHLPLLIPPNTDLCPDEVVTYDLLAFRIVQSRRLVKGVPIACDVPNSEDGVYEPELSDRESSGMSDEGSDDEDAYEDTDEELWYIPETTRGIPA